MELPPTPPRRYALTHRAGYCASLIYEGVIHERSGDIGSGPDCWRTIVNIPANVFTVKPFSVTRMSCPFPILDSVPFDLIGKQSFVNRHALRACAENIFVYDNIHAGRLAGRSGPLQGRTDFRGVDNMFSIPAHGLNYPVISQGSENACQVSLLRTIPCELKEPNLVPGCV